VTAQMQPVQPAIGGGGRLRRKVLVVEAVIALLLVVLLVIAKQYVTAREVGPDPLGALPGGETVAGLDIGGAPADYQLQALAASYHVDAVANLAGPDVAEQVTAASLHLAYLTLDVPPDSAPTWAQLQALATFLRAHAKNGDSVYVHDDIGGGRALSTACMLLLLRGTSWAAVQREATATGLKTLSPAQTQAVNQLNSALHSNGKSLSTNPYSNARIDPW
jgi:hypothetical protein